MRTQGEIQAIGVTRAVVGLSASVVIAPIKYQGSVQVSLLAAVSGTMLISGTTGSWTSGRPFISTGQADSMWVEGSPTLYLCATGATCTAVITYYLTQNPLLDP